MNLHERIERYLEKKDLSLPKAKTVTPESSKADYEAVLNSIKALKGQIFGVLKNVDSDSWRGLTSELKSLYTEIESKVMKRK